VGGFGAGGIALQRISSEEAAARLVSSLSGLSKSMDDLNSRRGGRMEAKKPPTAPSSRPTNSMGGGFELDLTRAALQPKTASSAGGQGAPAIPPIPGFGRVRSFDSAPAAEGDGDGGVSEPAAPAGPTAMPGLTSMKIPNFARALSGELPEAPPAKGGGSLSARELGGGATGLGGLLSPRGGAVEARRPLTARPAESLGVTTPRGTAMKGPIKGDRSTRGMDALLAASARGGPGGPLTPRNAPMTPRDGLLMSPRGGGAGGAPLTSPRGTGARSARRGGDECIKAPPARSPRGGGGGNGRGGAGDWLHAAIGADGHSWLRHARGACVLLRAEDASVAGATHRGKGTDASGRGPLLMGTVMAEVRSGAGSGSKWSVRLSGGREVLIEGTALRRVPPEGGDVARCVLGQSASLEGEVLSVERGVAVLRADGEGQKLPRVRVLPLDALCRLDDMLQADEAADDVAGGRAERAARGTAVELS
jgi:hypothetical protein